MKLNRSKIVGSLQLAVAVGLIVTGSWLMKQGDPQPEGAQLSDRDQHLTELAAAVSEAAPTSGGTGVIMGAQYLPGKNLFSFDVRPDPMIFDHVPEEMFFITAKDQFACSKQPAALIDLNREAAVRYRLFNSGGMVQDEITYAPKECSSIPIDTGRARIPQVPGLELQLD